MKRKLSTRSRKGIHCRERQPEACQSDEGASRRKELLIGAEMEVLCPDQVAVRCELKDLNVDRAAHVNHSSDTVDVLNDLSTESKAQLDETRPAKKKIKTSRRSLLRTC